jgi:hypothetical protein
MKMESFHSWEKKIWSTENNVRHNCDDTDHVLISVIDRAPGDGRMIGPSFSLWSFKVTKGSIYSYSVAELWLSSKLESKTIWTN